MYFREGLTLNVEFDRGFHSFICVIATYSREHFRDAVVFCGQQWNSSTSETAET